MSAPLSNKQKFILSDLARQAWSKQSEGFRREIDEHHFRHLAVLEAVGKAGLRSCTQADYANIKAHLLKILGREGESLKADVRGQSNGRRVAIWKLEEACKLAGVQISYAAAICRDKFKCSLDQATDKQLWKLKFDLDRAARRPAATEKSQTEIDYQLKP